MKWMYLLFIALFFSLNSFIVSATESPVDIKGVITINSYQAKKLHELGAPFIDIRPEKEWEWGRIKGAHNLVLHERFRELFMTGELDKTMPLVIYGNSSYHMSAAIASYLAALWGYKNIFFFRNGYFTWLALDYPVVLNSSEARYDEVSQL